MYKKLQLLIAVLFFGITAHAQRYLTEIFTNNQIVTLRDSIYGGNYSFLTGTPIFTDLYFDLYSPNPAIDAINKPLVIYMPTGSFLPPVVNGTPTGLKTDSAAAEMCRQFARRGYVAVSMSYRLGWNPVAIAEAIRTGTLLNAVYRSIQDAKACVRYFYKSASTGNPYKIDTTSIILGGQGSGGYIAIAYATLDKLAEINLPKFLSDTTIPQYGFVQGQSYVNPAVSGDFDGHGGNASYNSDNNSNGSSTKIHFCFNLGGALGDSSWLEAGDVPMVAFHVTGDPFAPYGDGPVIVPTTGEFVVNVSGSHTVIQNATALGNNNCFISAGFTDPYTQHANQANGGLDGLFPFEMNPFMQAGPWEWFDLQATRNFAQFLGYPPDQGDTVYNNALITNPNMSKAKALAYIDTIQNYLNPRIVYCLGLSTTIAENNTGTIPVIAMPNPASDQVIIELRQTGNRITAVELADLTGRMIQSEYGFYDNKHTLSRNHIDAGIYIAKIITEKGNTSLRIVFN